MIICIHTAYHGKIYFDPLFRFAVPFFFMVTGYFYSSIKEKHREYFQIKKMVILLLSSNFLYLIWTFMICIDTNVSISDYLRSALSLKAWIRFLCFNESLFIGHLWYLGALVYVLVIILIFDKYSSREKLYKFIPILLLTNIIMGNYSTIIFRETLPLILTRNFLFLGLPFFLLGDIIYKKQSNPTRRQLLSLLILSVILTITENLLFLKIAAAFNADFFLATPFLAYSLFMLFLEDRPFFHHPLLIKVAQLSKDTSITVYIIHPILIIFFENIVTDISKHIPYMSTIWSYIGPVIILLTCTFFAYCLKALKSKFNNIPCFFQKSY